MQTSQLALQKHTYLSFFVILQQVCGKWTKTETSHSFEHLILIIDQKLEIEDHAEGITKAIRTNVSTLM